MLISGSCKLFLGYRNFLCPLQTTTWQLPTTPCQGYKVHGCFSHIKHLVCEERGNPGCLWCLAQFQIFKYCTIHSYNYNSFISAIGNIKSISQTECGCHSYLLFFVLMSSLLHWLFLFVIVCVYQKIIYKQGITVILLSNSV